MSHARPDEMPPLVVGTGAAISGAQVLVEKLRNVFFSEDFDPAAGDVFEDDSANLHTDQFFDEIAVGFEESPDLSFFAMMEVHFESAPVAVPDCGSGDDFFGFEEVALILDTSQQLWNILFVKIAVQDDAVALDHLGAGVR